MNRLCCTTPSGMRREIPTLYAITVIIAAIQFADAQEDHKHIERYTNVAFQRPGEGKHPPVADEKPNSHSRLSTGVRQVSRRVCSTAALPCKVITANNENNTCVRRGIATNMNVVYNRAVM